MCTSAQVHISAVFTCSICIWVAAGFRRLVLLLPLFLPLFFLLFLLPLFPFLAAMVVGGRGRGRGAVWIGGGGGSRVLKQLLQLLDPVNRNQKERRRWGLVQGGRAQVTSSQMPRVGKHLKCPWARDYFCPSTGFSEPWGWPSAYLCYISSNCQQKPEFLLKLQVWGGFSQKIETSLDNRGHLVTQILPQNKSCTQFPF